jgi:hypothetical protein
MLPVFAAWVVVVAHPTRADGGRGVGSERDRPTKGADWGRVSGVRTRFDICLEGARVDVAEGVCLVGGGAVGVLRLLACACPLDVGVVVAVVDDKGGDRRVDACERMLRRAGGDGISEASAVVEVGMVIGLNSIARARTTAESPFSPSPLVFSSVAGSSTYTSTTHTHTYTHTHTHTHTHIHTHTHT